MQTETVELPASGPQKVHSLSRFNIGIQIGIGFAVAIVLMCLSAAITYSQSTVMRTQHDGVITRAAIRHDTHRFLEAMVDQETGMRAYVATGDEKFLAPLVGGREALPSIIAQLQRQTATDRNLSEPIESAIGHAKDVGAYFDSQVALVHSGKTAQAIKSLGDGKTAFDAFRSDYAKAMNEIQRANVQATLEYDRAARTQMTMMIVTTFGSILAMGAFAIFLGRMIAQRLLTVTNGLQSIVADDFAGLLVAYDQLEGGNLRAEFSVRSQPIDERGADEIARLAKSYNGLSRGLAASALKFSQTTKRLRTVMRGVDAATRELNDTSAQVSDASAQSTISVRQISSVIEGVARGASQQAEGVASVSSAAEELSRTAAQIATGSVDQAVAVQAVGSAVNRLDEQIASFAALGDSLAQAARRANEQSSGGTAAVLETTSAMTTLRDEAANTGRAMAKLEEKSAAVEEIVSTIDEIADQTNLLALNAAIEAARAGEHGRGFSVVADEVRKLAERAATSTRQINKILSEIRRETSATGAVVRASVTSMEAGLGLASRASESLQNVSNAIAETTRIADDVASVAKTMRNVSAEVTANVSSVSAVIEENAAASQEMQRTTELLTAAMLPIADLASQQSASASEVSSSAMTLSTNVEGIASSAQHVRTQAECLTESVAGFSIDEAVTPATTGSNPAPRQPERTFATA